MGVKFVACSTVMRKLRAILLQPQAPLSTVACVQHHRAQSKSVNGPREMVTMTTAQSHVVMTTGESALSQEVR